MILGIDSHGELYVSLLQANSNTAVMNVFFTQLIATLDQQRQDWRQDTIFLLDVSVAGILRVDKLLLMLLG